MYQHPDQAVPESLHVSIAAVVEDVRVLPIRQRRAVTEMIALLLLRHLSPADRADVISRVLSTSVQRN